MNTAAEDRLIARIGALLDERLEVLLVKLQGTPRPAPTADEELVSTAKMATLLGMSSDAFKWWYRHHPSLEALCTRHGRHRKWPVGVVKLWFQHHRGGQ